MVATLPRLPAPILRALLDCATEEDRTGERAFSIIDLDADDEVNRAVWTKHGAVLLGAWLEEHPGTRPSGWWRALAPRQPIGTWPGAFWDGQLQLPRERLGGIGTPAWEVLGYVPLYHCGLPAIWLTPFEVACYTGVARDVRGDPIMPEYADRAEPFRGVAPDPADPPLYEAQASYLQRHGLLLPGEARRLRKVDFQPEAIEVEPEDEP